MLTRATHGIRLVLNKEVVHRRIRRAEICMSVRDLPSIKNIIETLKLQEQSQAC